jgi:hypothetical protein
MIPEAPSPRTINTGVVSSKTIFHIYIYADIFYSVHNLTVPVD